MTWDAQTGVIVVGVIAVLALALALGLAWRTGRMRRQYAVLSAADGRASFIEVVSRKTEEVEALRDDVAALVDELRSTQRDLQQAVRHVGIVRYDAFGDMGGRMSFSAALIDDHGNGFVLSTIHARSESRSYVKEIRGGMAEVHLSPEESAAVADAVASIPRGRLD
jgi:type II secretory pathway pseudopilin PulG